ncbi:MAG TPA: hypothetical protein VIK14_06235 [Ignavibacteria bacterium]
MLKRIKEIERLLIDRVNPVKIFIILRDRNNKYHYKNFIYDSLEDFKKENNFIENNDDLLVYIPVK